MTLHNHFHSFLDEVHREGRYRVFTNLEHAKRNARSWSPSLIGSAATCISSAG